MRKHLALPDDAPTFEPNFGTSDLGSQNNDSLGPAPQIGLLSFEVNDNMLDSPGSYVPFDDKNTTFPTNSTCPKTTHPDIDDSRTLLVDWYHDQDDENPRNWSPYRKMWITSVICTYTFVVYCASSICVPRAPYMMARYHISIRTASLELACYVLGYGVGPMFFSPLSEMASIGRNLPYISSFVLFLVVSALTATVDNYPALVFLRTLQGLFGSPALATGAASLEDVYGLSEVPYAFIFWVGAMYAGPALGPLLSGYAISADWRWPMYEVVIMGAGVFLMLLTLPETSANNILLRRARRWRRSTGNSQYKTAYETKDMGVRQIFIDAMIKPVEISVKDPAIAFACIYSAILYGIYYSFFEVFPLVYMELYHFSIGATSLVFITIIIGLIVVAPVYAMYLRWIFLPKSSSASFEDRLYLALFATWFPIFGLIIFAWTAKPTVHWIWSTIGIGIYSGSSFIVFQCLICWLPLSYPRYVASLLAANDLCRSLAAVVFVLVSRDMYLDLGVSKGVTLLAGLSCVGVVGMFILYFLGAAMRARSKFAQS